MRLGSNGILVNEHGQILLIQRNDTRTYAPPGGGIERGERPTDNVAREIREETGIIALPVRLVSLNFWDMKPEGFLVFTFRCLRRGGELQTSAESPRVGFFATNLLPKPMLSLSRRRIEAALKHTGGPVEWWITHTSLVIQLGRFLVYNVVHPWFDLRRKWRQQPAHTPAPSWNISVRTVIQNGEGAVLQLEGENGWQLPGGLVNGITAPWNTAVTRTKTQTGLDIRLTNVTGVYIIEGTTDMILVFTAVADSITPLNSKCQWRIPTSPPEKTQEPTHQFIHNALAPGSETSFHLLTAY